MTYRLFNCVLIYAVVTLSNGSPTGNEDGNNGVLLGADLAADLENWMSLLPNDIRNVPLNYLAIPGSHDSFTQNISWTSDVSPDGADILKKLEFLVFVRAVIANWSKTQAYNALQQLQAGIRYFDLRLCENSNDGNIYFCHGMYSFEINGVLTDINDYLENHTNEVVILDCQHFYNFTSDTHTEVIALLKSIFGDKLIPEQNSMNSLTLANLAANKQQVLIVYRDASQTGNSFLWPSDSLPTPWYDTMNTTYLLESLDSGLQSRTSSSGYVSQLILTPSVDDILENLLTTLRQKCAVEFQTLRTSWIANQRAGKGGVNVIIADFVDLSNNTFSKTVINLNSQIDVASLNAPSLLKRIGQFFVTYINYFR